MYTHRKSLANLRVIFQKAEEMASELPYPISKIDSESSLQLYRKGLRLRTGEVSISYTYRTPPVPFKNQDLTMLERDGSNFGAKTTPKKMLS